MSTKASNNKAVATKSTTTDTSMFEADAGVGFDEGVDKGAFAIPFLSILQGLSPQQQRGNAVYINGAQAGMFYNTVTKELFDAGTTGLDVSVVRRTHTFCLWTPRDDGGGFKGEYEATEQAVAEFNAIKPDDKGRRINAFGEEVTEHRNFYCQMIRDGRADEPVVVSMTKSQLKAARQWNSMISMRSARVGQHRAPVALSEIWNLKTQLKTKGDNSWFIYVVDHVGRHNDPSVYEQVREAVAFAKEHKVAPRQQLEQTPDDGAL